MSQVKFEDETGEVEGEGRERYQGASASHLTDRIIAFERDWPSLEPIPFSKVRRILSSLDLRVRFGLWEGRVWDKIRKNRCQRLGRLLMGEIKSRNTQTRVKHEILERYLDAWGHIIANGLKSARHQIEWHFVYVDCFSFIGRYAGEKEDEIKNNPGQNVYGSPIIGIKALEKLEEYSRKIGISVRVNSILVEKNKKHFVELKETLRLSGYGDSFIETDDFQQLRDGQIAVVNADAISLVDKLLSYTSHPDVWAFYFIDPYGPSGIPYKFVSKVVKQNHHDVMINFIYEDFIRKTGMAFKENLEPKYKSLVQNWTDAFGSNDWKKIAKQLIAEEVNSRDLRETLGEYGEGIVPSLVELRDIKEQRFVAAYKDVLYSMDTSLAVKLVNLRFGDKERTVFYLYLTTHDPTGALELNKILYDAKYLEHELRYRLKFAKRVAPPESQPFLLPPTDEVQIPKFEKPSRPSTEDIEKIIIARFSGKTVTRKDIYRELANDEYFPAEVDKTLRQLRKDKKAEFIDPLRHRTVIKIL